MKEAWLKCELSNGMFPDENGVYFKDVSNQEVSLFCYKDLVDEKSATLKVKILNEKGDSYDVRLPVDTFNGFSIVTVNKCQLTNIRELQSV